MRHDADSIIGVRVYVGVTDAEGAAIDEARWQAKMSRSEWIRAACRMALDATTVHPPRGVATPAPQEAAPVRTSAPPPVKRRNYPPLAQTITSARAKQLVASRPNTCPHANTVGKLGGTLCADCGEFV